MILRSQEVIADTYRIVTILREGMDHGREHVLHRLRFLLLYEDHRQLHDITYHNGRGDTARLDGHDLVYLTILKTTDKFLGDLIHQHRVHLMIDKTIHFKDTAGITAAVLQDALLQ